MTNSTTPPIVVGIDGSDAAHRAALWAADEVGHRHAALRLVWVVRTDLSGTPTASEYHHAVDTAKHALHAVQADVAAAAPDVDVEVSIQQGFPAGILLAESRDATMLCLGSSGIGHLGAAFLGSTVAEVAAHADCPVAIVASTRDSARSTREASWVVFPADPWTSDDRAAAAAMQQAEVLHRPVLALGTRHPNLGLVPSDTLSDMAARWSLAHPGIRVHPVWTDGDLAGFVKANPELNALVVIDEAHAADVAALIRAGHAHAAGVEFVVVVSREHAHERPTERTAAPR